MERPPGFDLLHIGRHQAVGAGLALCGSSRTWGHCKVEAAMPTPEARSR
jgi:hypothetical protein